MSTTDRPACERVRSALDAVLTSETFARSERLRSFLAYIVQNELSGKAAQLKGYSIGIDVFGRTSGFDAGNDPLVRVQAGKLRKLLDQYYETEGASDCLSIRVPLGSYVPEYLLREKREVSTARAASPPPKPRRPWIPAPVSSPLALLSLLPLVFLAPFAYPDQTDAAIAKAVGSRPGVTAYLPSSTLAAVVIVSAASLVDVTTLVRLARMSRTETVLLIAAFLGVAFIGVLQGIIVAVGLSLLAFVRQTWEPYRTELVSLEGIPGYHDLSRHPEGERVPGLVIARFDAPLFFANGAVFDAFVRGLVEGAPGPVRWVIIAAEALTGIDTTALEDLVELDDHLDRQGISLVFAEMKGPIKDRLVRFGVGSRFGPEHFFPTVNSAVKAYRKTYDV